MALPAFTSIRFRRKEKKHGETETAVQHKGLSSDGGIFEDSHTTSEGASTSKPSVPYISEGQIEKFTRTRHTFIVISTTFFCISVIFLLLTIIGNINDKPVIRSTYFLKLDLSGVYPQAFNSDDLVFVNSIARSLGLHDFYQVGLWSYCEGYSDEGITNCSPPQNMYWFNPVAIILDQLLAGATIALPSDVISTLSLVKTASNIMFGFFLTGIILAAFCVFVTPVAIYSHWWSLPLSILTFITALLITTSCIIATVMFSIFKSVLTSQPGLNISANLGTQMLAFMWIGAGGSLIGFVIQLCLSCCCVSRRDVMIGRWTGCCCCCARKRDIDTDRTMDASGDVSPVPVEGEKKSGGRRRWAGIKRTKGEVQEVPDQ